MNFERFKTLKLPFNKPGPILWTSTSYFANLEILDQKTLHNSLTWDLITFLHEYVGLKDKKIYSYGERGVMNAYPVKTSQICQHQEQTLKEQDLEITRAQLETKTALTVEAWMKENKGEIGEKLITISPRGKRSEGYPGLNPKNYIFINIYTKVGENDFQLIQYTSYAKEKKLQKLQNQIIKQLNGQTHTPKSDKQIENIKLKSLSHKIIDKPITLPCETSFEQIEELIYQDEDSWTTTRKDLPKVDEIEFSNQLEIVLQTLLEQFWLLAKQSPNSSVIHFDQLIIIVREHFLKWVEDHATNYNHDKNLAPYALNLEEILERWQLTIKRKEEKLTKQEQNKLKVIKKAVELNPLQPLLRVSSVAHCIVGTPGSFMFKTINLNPNLLSLSSPDFISLSVKDKRSLLDKLRQENMIEITLSNKETWMVPSNFLDGKGCFVDENNIAMGPCDVPLKNSFAFKMNKIEFDQFVYGLEQQLLENKLNQTEEEITNNLGPISVESKQLKEKIKQIKKLIFKPTVSITELISGDFICSSVGQSKLVTKIIKMLKNSNNPIQTCEKILKKLELDQNGVLALGNV